MTKSKDKQRIAYLEAALIEIAEIAEVSEGGAAAFYAMLAKKALTGNDAHNAKRQAMIEAAATIEIIDLTPTTGASAPATPQGEKTMKPGQMTFVSAGTLQGVYRPQVRIYYNNAKHGICFETMTKPLRCRSRKRAIQLAKDWIKTPEFAAEADAVRVRIASNPENEI